MMLVAASALKIYRLVLVSAAVRSKHIHVRTLGLLLAQYPSLSICLCYDHDVMQQRRSASCMH